VQHREAAVYVGGEAREDRFKSDAARFSVLHLASHGMLDAASPLYSHVVLAPGAGTDEDGLLEAWEIMEMRLDADVVVLSACDTGRGRIAPNTPFLRCRVGAGRCDRRSIQIRCAIVAFELLTSYAEDTEQGMRPLIN